MAVSVGDRQSSESDIESEPGAEREGGERVTMETIQDWVQSATGKVSGQCMCFMCGELLWGVMQ